jgi:hypothetical protein
MAGKTRVSVKTKKLRGKATVRGGAETATRTDAFQRIVTEEITGVRRRMPVPPDADPASGYGETIFYGRPRGHATDLDLQHPSETWHSATRAASSGEKVRAFVKLPKRSNLPADPHPDTRIGCSSASRCSGRRASPRGEGRSLSSGRLFSLPCDVAYYPSRSHLSPFCCSMRCKDHWSFAHSPPRPRDQALKFIDLDQSCSSPTPIVASTNRGGCNEASQHQAGSFGCRRGRVRNFRVGSMVAKRRSARVYRKRTGQGGTTVDPGERRWRCTTNDTARGCRRSGRRCSRCRHSLRPPRAGKWSICLPLKRSAARAQVSVTASAN